MRQLVFLPITIFALTAVCTAMICLIIEVRERRRMGHFARGAPGTGALKSRRHRRASGPRLIYSSVSRGTKDEIGSGPLPIPSVAESIAWDEIHAATLGLR
jgi:hypothetical protein